MRRCKRVCEGGVRHGIWGCRVWSKKITQTISATSGARFEVQGLGLGYGL